MSNRFWFNDANAPLIDLRRTLINQPDSLAEQYSSRWHDQLGRERDYYDYIRNRFNRGHDPVDLLYLMARCVKAAVYP